MSDLVTVDVLFEVKRPDGTLVPHAKVRAKLTTLETDGQLVVPSIVEEQADDNALALLALWPNSRGANGSRYGISITDADDMPVGSGHIVVPEVDVALQPVRADLILDRAPYPTLTAAQQAVRQLQEAQVEIAAQVQQVDEDRIAAQQARAAAAASAAAMGVQDATTDDLPEGDTNLYWTAARCLATALTGLSLATATPITAADTILTGMGKLQAQITALDEGKASLGGAAFTGDISTTGALTIAPAIGATAAYYRLTNTGGSYYFGVEDGTGGTFGATPYAQVTFAPVGRVIQQLIGGSTPITTVSSSGLAVTGALTATGGITSGADGSGVAFHFPASAAIRSADVSAAGTAYFDVANFQWRDPSAGYSVLMEYAPGAINLRRNTVVTGALNVTGQITGHGDLSITNDATYTVALTAGGAMGAASFGGTAGTTTLNLMANGATVASLASGNGLAVTGAISSTVPDAEIAQRLSAGAGMFRFRPYVDATYGAILDVTNVAEDAYLPLTLTGATVRFGVTGAGIVGQFSSTGLAVTGGLSTTGPADFGGGVAAGARAATFVSTTGDRLRAYSLAAGSGFLLDVSDAGETTTARPLNLGGSNGTVNLVGTTVAVSPAGLAVSGVLNVSSDAFFPIGFYTNGSTKRIHNYISGDSLLWVRETLAGVFEAIPLTLSASGNLGLGAPPSAWGSTVRALNLGNAADQSNFIAGYNGAPLLMLGSGAYHNGADWVYAGSAAAALFTADAGTFAWKTAAAGNAGDPIGFTERMNLSATGLAVTGRLSTTGSVGIGSPNPAAKFEVIQNALATAVAIEKPGVGQALFLYNGTSTNYIDADTQNFRTGAGVTVATLSSAGLAVTGALSATGGILASSGVIRASSFSTITNPAGGGTIRLSNGSTIKHRNATNDGDLITLSVSGTTVTLGDIYTDIVVAKTLAVNGAISGTTLRVNTAPVAETPAATHTLTINVNGTNYKALLAPV